MMNMQFSMKDADKLDARDPLSRFRDRFYHSGERLIYLDGNSLGKLPLETISHIEAVVQKEWGSRLIRSWNERWWRLNRELGNRIARLVGAKEGEVVVSDSTSVNLYKLAWAAMNHLKKRTHIVSDVFNFPSDLYILQGVAMQFHPVRRIVLAPSDDGIHINTGKLKDLISEDTALVCLSLVAYGNAFMYNMADITRAAHEKGAMVLWDLSHAVGAVPVDLERSDADLAVGCTYKYLNGGPGSPAFLYVRKSLQKKLVNPLQAWTGTKNPFDFSKEYTPPGTIDGWLTGSPTILSMTTLDKSLDMLEESGMERLREKSILLTEFMIALTREHLVPRGFRIATPENPEQRGSHVSLKHPEAYRITQALIHPPEGKVRIIPDFRAPDLVRLGFAPLYNRFDDVYQTVIRLSEIVEDQEYAAFPVSGPEVT